MKDMTIFKPYALYGMGTSGVVEIRHVKTGRVYSFLAIVIREHDLEPCALYARGFDPMWVRPLREILQGGRWAWDAKWEPLFIDLIYRLAKYDLAKGEE